MKKKQDKGILYLSLWDYILEEVDDSKINKIWQGKTDEDKDRKIINN